MLTCRYPLVFLLQISEVHVGLDCLTSSVKLIRIRDTIQYYVISAIWSYPYLVSDTLWEWVGSFTPGPLFFLVLWLAGQDEGGREGMSSGSARCGVHGYQWGFKRTGIISWFLTISLPSLFCTWRCWGSGEQILWWESHLYQDINYCSAQLQ